MSGIIDRFKLWIINNHVITLIVGNVVIFTMLLSGKEISYRVINV